MSRVFCIGFHKTGTTSLAAALRRLGYRVSDAFGVRDPRIGETLIPRARARLELFDAFRDLPWPVLFRELDAWSPGARFIFTRRDEDAWWRSVLAHFGSVGTPLRAWVYGGTGAPVGAEAVWRARYAAHNRAVETWFGSRPRDLLRLDLETGLDWEPLCDFLGRPAPSEPFPMLNTAAERRLKRALRKAGLGARREADASPTQDRWRRAPSPLSSPGSAG